MKSRKEVALWAGGALAILAGLFPPWVRTVSGPGMETTLTPAGFSPLWDPPVPKREGNAYGVRLDYGRLFIECGIIALLTAGIASLGLRYPHCHTGKDSRQ